MRNFTAVTRILGICAILYIGGCVKEVRLKNAFTQPDANPATGRAVSVSVVDGRQFDVHAHDAESPRLLHKSDIGKSEVTLRAIGRGQINFYTYVFHYPDHKDETVLSAVRVAVENALRSKGYVVVPEGSPGSVPVHAVIQKFWTWIDEGAWTIGAFADVQVDVSGSVVSNGQLVRVEGSHKIHTMYWVDAINRNCVRDSLRELTTNLAQNIKSP